TPRAARGRRCRGRGGTAACRARPDRRGRARCPRGPGSWARGSASGSRPARETRRARAMRGRTGEPSASRRAFKGDTRGALGLTRGGLRITIAKEKRNTGSPAREPMYVELHASSAFSFLRGSSLPEELVARAAALGYAAVALVDRDGVAGAPRFYKAARAAGGPPLVGVEFSLA